MKLGPLLRESRLAAGLSLATTAMRVKCSPSYLCRIEQGDRSRRPSTRLLSRLALVLNIDADVIFVAAERVPADLVKFILSTPEALVRLRKLQRAAAA